MKAAESDARGVTESAYPPLRQAWSVIAVLFLVTLFSQLDRQLPALLVGPIKQEFAISDTQFSLLQGYAFAIVYAFLGLPLGRLVDRANRRNLIIVGVTFWSLMTAAAAFAQTYWQLFATRIGVGVGEACLAPAAYSMIADYFAPGRRGRALGIYYVSLAIGGGASLLLGGAALRLLPESMPFSLEPWRLMFILAGAPGLILALLMLAIREPERRETYSSSTAPGTSLHDLFAHLGRHRGAYWRIFAYTSLLAVVGYAAAGWGPALYVRRFGMSPAAAGMATGIALMTAGVVGSLASAFLSDRWKARGVRAARFRLTIIGFAIVIPSAVLWPIVPAASLSVVLFGVTLTGSCFALAAAAPSIQEITPNAMRGQVIAIYLLFSGLIGMGFGPTAVALVTDYVFHDDAALPYALALICGPLGLVGILVCGTGLGAYATAQAEAADRARTHQGPELGAPANAVETS